MENYTARQRGLNSMVAISLLMGTAQLIALLFSWFNHTHMALEMYLAMPNVFFYVEKGLWAIPQLAVVKPILAALKGI